MEKLENVPEKYLDSTLKMVSKPDNTDMKVAKVKQALPTYNLFYTAQCFTKELIHIGLLNFHPFLHIYIFFLFFFV